MVKAICAVSERVHFVSCSCMLLLFALLSFGPFRFPCFFLGCRVVSHPLMCNGLMLVVYLLILCSVALLLMSIQGGR